MKVVEEKKIYTTYSPKADITFIMEETFINGENVSTEIKGFYYGEPDEKCTKEFYGKLKAEY